MHIFPGYVGTAQKLFGLKVEAKVAVRNREALHERFNNPPSNCSREQCVPPKQHLCYKRLIAGKKLIATVTAERNRHMLSREAREKIVGQNCRASNRLIK